MNRPYIYFKPCYGVVDRCNKLGLAAHIELESGSEKREIAHAHDCTIGSTDKIGYVLQKQRENRTQISTESAMQTGKLANEPADSNTQPLQCHSHDR